MPLLTESNVTIFNEVHCLKLKLEQSWRYFKGQPNQLTFNLFTIAESVSSPIVRLGKQAVTVLREGACLAVYLFRLSVALPVIALCFDAYLVAYYFELPDALPVIGQLLQIATHYANGGCDGETAVRNPHDPIQEAGTEAEAGETAVRTPHHLIQGIAGPEAEATELSLSPNSDHRVAHRRLSGGWNDGEACITAESLT